MQISTANFITEIKKKSVNLLYANFGLFCFIGPIFWAKIAKRIAPMKKIAKNSHKANFFQIQKSH
jgi:hypothetical protein